MHLPLEKWRGPYAGGGGSSTGFTRGFTRLSDGERARLPGGPFHPGKGVRPLCFAEPDEQRSAARARLRSERVGQYALYSV